MSIEPKVGIIRLILFKAGSVILYVASSTAKTKRFCGKIQNSPLNSDQENSGDEIFVVPPSRSWKKNNSTSSYATFVNRPNIDRDISTIYVIVRRVFRCFFSWLMPAKIWLISCWLIPR